jgi:hypothetical protein
MSGEARLTAEPLGAGGAADDDRGGHGPAAALIKQRRAVRLQQGLELGEQVTFLTRDLPDPCDQGFGDP